ncbi:MAG: putative lipid II flippase FtsW [Candidatus Sumerlaea chitinivorans]|nr:putative lipid II flippase FtsW [Candidatus Sumerlaea chitinivorans]
MRFGLTRMIFYLTLTLLAIGLTLVYSSSAGEALRELRSSHFKQIGTFASAPETPIAIQTLKILFKQVLATIIGIIAMLICYRIDYDKYKKWAFWMLITSVVMLCLVFVPGIGKRINGANRWFGIGPVQFQASEFAKLALIIFLAKKLSERAHELKSFRKGLLPLLIVVGLVLGLIAPEPDLGSCLVIGMIAFVMFFVAGVPLKHVGFFMTAGVILAIIAVVVEPYRVRRVLVFLDPESDPLRSGYQLLQSLISVGSGGLFGVGLGQGPQKYLYMSEMRTDFIFSAICEELGLVGGTVIVLLYVLFVWLGYCVATRVSDLYACLLATGITTMIGGQALFHIVVVLGMAPTKGLTLPLISWGGSSLVVNLIAIGILLSVARVVETEFMAYSMPPRRGRPAPVTA